VKLLKDNFELIAVALLTANLAMSGLALLVGIYVAAVGVSVHENADFATTKEATLAAVREETNVMKEEVLRFLEQADAAKASR